MVDAETCAATIVYELTVEGARSVYPKTMLVVRGDMAVDKGATNEETFRRAIDRSDGRERQVLIDAYRLLVLANFAACEGESGQSAKALLDQHFPYQGTVDAAPLSGRVNLPGMLLYHVLEHPNDPDWEIVAGVLVHGCDAGAFGRPRIESA